MSKEIIKRPKSKNNILSPIAEDIATKEKVKFYGRCLIQDRITYTPQAIVNSYIVYKITKNNPTSSYPTLENCFLGTTKLTKNPDIDKYKYSGYGIRFDRRGQFSFGGEFGQNIIIFGVDMSNSVHANNTTKNILILGEGCAQGLDNTTIHAEKLYSMNFTKNNKKFCLILHYNGSNSYLFVSSTEIHKFKTKDFEILATPLCLENISRD